MPESNTTILIPDISGYTEFITTTELNHGAMAINMFLDTMVQAVGEEYEVSEIEGDALLLVRKGPPPSKKEITDICLKIFNAFHVQRLWMEQHTICPCKACLGIKNLTLKFVAHHGPLAEVKVGRIVKQSGKDMIIAHRLLKNNIGANEYLLMTDKLWSTEPESDHTAELNWVASTEEYASIGQVPFRFALLNEARNQVPKPPELMSSYATDETPFYEIEIETDYKDVYMVLKQIPNWAHWVPGLQHVEQDFPEPFLGSLHYCAFDEYKTLISPLKMTLSEQSIQYAESCKIAELHLAMVHEYDFKRTGEHSSLFSCRLLNASPTPIPTEFYDMLLTKQRQMAESLKIHCEKLEESFF